MTPQIIPRKRNVRITCIAKGSDAEGRACILSFGGTRPDGSAWRLSEEDMIRSIERGLSFFIVLGSQAVPVIVAERRDQKFVKTGLDRDMPDYLLRLPECK
jgi:hypothetical protein